MPRDQDAAQSKPVLTGPQREFLQRLAAADYGELYIKGSADHRVYRALRDKGCVEYRSGGWGKITPLGRKLVA